MLLVLDISSGCKIKLSKDRKASGVEYSYFPKVTLARDKNVTELELNLEKPKWSSNAIGDLGLEARLSKFRHIALYDTTGASRDLVNTQQPVSKLLAESTNITSPEDCISCARFVNGVMRTIAPLQKTAPPHDASIVGVDARFTPPNHKSVGVSSPRPYN